MFYNNEQSLTSLKNKWHEIWYIEILAILIYKVTVLWFKGLTSLMNEA
jgi:hypothetical protein